MHKIALLAVTAFTAVSGITLGGVNHLHNLKDEPTDKLETFKINLDDPPKMRFVEPTKKFNTKIIDTLKYYEDNIIKYLVPAHLASVIDYSYWIGHRESYLEMEGIGLALGIDPKRVVIANFAYEYFVYCTSLLAK